MALSAASIAAIKAARVALRNEKERLIAERDVRTANIAANQAEKATYTSRITEINAQLAALTADLPEVTDEVAVGP